jgi:hypothetical protein
MRSFLPQLTSADWAIVIAVILVPLLMVFGVYAIRTEIREALRIEAKSVRLKTSQEILASRGLAPINEPTEATKRIDAR